MKAINYIVFVVLLVGCKQGSKSVDAVQKPDTLKSDPKAVSFKEFSLNKDYIAVDTGKYSNDGPMTGGSYAIIKKNGAIADTIDLYFGIKELGEHVYLYQKLHHESDLSIKESKGDLSLNPGSYFLIKNNLKSVLKDIIPNFDDNFSSPAAIKRKIYYWQLEKIDSAGTLKVSATEYNPLTNKTKSHFLANTVLQTDDSNYFLTPYIEKDSIIYVSDDKKKWKFSTEFNPN